MATLGAKLKQLRKEAELSQEDLSIKLNKQFGTSINKGMISKWENDKEEPRMEYVRNISTFFKVSLDFLLGVDDFNNSTYFKEDQAVYNTEIKVIAAHAISDLDDEQIKKVIEYAKFIKSQHK